MNCGVLTSIHCTGKLWRRKRFGVLKQEFTVNNSYCNYSQLVCQHVSLLHSQVNITFSSQPIDVAIATEAAILDEDLDSRIISMVVAKDNVLVDDFLLVNICPMDDSDVCWIW